MAWRRNTRISKTDDQGAEHNSEMPQGQSSIMVKCQFQKMFSHCVFYYCSVRFFSVNQFTCIQRCIPASCMSHYFFLFSFCRSGFYHLLVLLYSLAIGFPDSPVSTFLLFAIRCTLWEYHDHHTAVSPASSWAAHYWIIWPTLKLHVFLLTCRCEFARV